MILSVETQSNIRRLHDIFVARMAFEYRCEQPDVLAAIQPQPTPAPVPAASPPAVAPAVEEQAGEGVTASPADPLPETVTSGEAQATAAAVGASPAIQEAEDIGSQPAGGENVTASTGLNTGAVGASAPATPIKPLSRRAVLRALVAEHPDWTANEIAPAMGIAEDNVRSIASQIGIRLPKQAKSSKQAVTTAALKASVQEKSHPPAAVAPPTTRSRVAALHAEHPEFTGAMAAEYLGISKGTLDGASFNLGVKWTRVIRVKRAAGQPAKVAVPAIDPIVARDDLDRRLIALHQAEPDLIRPRLAERLGVTRFQINDAVVRLELKVPRATRGKDGVFEPEVIPLATPQTPVAPPPKKQTTLKDQVSVLHQQHPNWTARLIAKELGVKMARVNTILGLLRGRAGRVLAETPEFTSRRQMVKHYGEVAKRLGKRS
ncbi:MAG TPA: hypothetical protein VL147_06075 [Devosia sp.]|nr:hypothetical protein [Devosia sp.]